MNLFSTGLTFIIIWWLVLFMVLPFGAAPPADAEIEPGTARSAPARPRLLMKMLVTTGIAILLTIAARWFIESGFIQVRPPSGG
jgi:predicted secreted protein